MIIAASGPTRCDGLWFPDGDVILETKNKLFQVDHHKLAEVSPVFRDRINAIKRKPTKSLRRPRIQLEHDSDDLELLLIAVFIPQYVPIICNTVT
jgi:hypothetical protein